MKYEFNKNDSLDLEEKVKKDKEIFRGELEAVVSEFVSTHGFINISRIRVDLLGKFNAGLEKVGTEIVITVE